MKKRYVALVLAGVAAVLVARYLWWSYQEFDNQP